MGDSVAPSCVNVIPGAADTAFHIHRMKRSAYTAVLGSFRAQSDLLSGVLPLACTSSVVKIITKQIICNRKYAVC
jgi:hypothetical protein